MHSPFGRGQSFRRKCRKNFDFLKKVFKKVLTKGKVSDIISRLSARRASLVLENWTTKREVQSKSFRYREVCKVCEIQDLAILKENTTQNKSKTSKSSLVDWIVSWGIRFNTILSRVWSWLRMNAGGVHNTFKSNGEPFGGISGGRVSNAWATCLTVRDNVRKQTLIPYNAWISHVDHAKDLLL